MPNSNQFDQYEYRGNEKRNYDYSHDDREDYSLTKIPKLEEIATKMPPIGMNSNIARMQPDINMNSFPESKTESYKMTDVELVDNAADIIESHGNELNKTISLVEGMTMTDDLDYMITLALTMDNHRDRNTIANVMSQLYINKYQDLVKDDSELEDWIICVINLIVFEHIDKIKQNTQIKKATLVRTVGLKLLGMKNTKVVPNNVVESDVDCSYLSTMAVFTKYPKLLNIGQMLKVVVPVSFAVKYMKANNGTVVRTGKASMKTQVTGIYFTFSLPVLCRIQSNVVKGITWYRIGRTEHLSRTFEEVMNRSTIPTSFTMGTKRDENSFLLNDISNITRFSEYNGGEYNYYSILDRGTCVGIDDKSYNFKSYSNVSFIYDNTSRSLNIVKNCIQTSESDLKTRAPGIYDRMVDYYKGIKPNYVEMIEESRKQYLEMNNE